jgi:hypothetical protein
MGRRLIWTEQASSDIEAIVRYPLLDLFFSPFGIPAGHQVLQLIHVRRQRGRQHGIRIDPRTVTLNQSMSSNSRFKKSYSSAQMTSSGFPG